MAADIATKAAEHDRWQGMGLIPMRGCTLTRLPMGMNCSVMVEYETLDDQCIVQRLLINGCMVSAEDWVHPVQLEAWEELLWNDHKSAGKLAVSVVDLRRAA